MGEPVEIIFIDNTGCNALVMLTEEVQKTVWASREYMNYNVRIIDLQLPKMIGYLFSECGRVLSACHALLARSHRQGEGN